MKGKLGGFTRCPAEDQQDRRAEDAGGDGCETAGIRPDAHFSKGQGAGDAPEHQDADHKAEIADAVGKHGLLRGIGSGILLVPMTDQ